MAEIKLAMHVARGAGCGHTMATGDALSMRKFADAAAGLGISVEVTETTGEDLGVALTQLLRAEKCDQCSVPPGGRRG